MTRSRIGFGLAVAIAACATGARAQQPAASASASAGISIEVLPDAPEDQPASDSFAVQTASPIPAPRAAPIASAEADPWAPAPHAAARAPSIGSNRLLNTGVGLIIGAVVCLPVGAGVFAWSQAQIMKANNMVAPINGDFGGDVAVTYFTEKIDELVRGVGIALMAAGGAMAAAGIPLTVVGSLRRSSPAIVRIDLGPGFVRGAF